MISTTDRADALRRAQEALSLLEDHDGTSRHQLGQARDHLNRVWTRPSPEEVWQSVHEIEGLVLDVYGTADDNTT